MRFLMVSGFLWLKVSRMEAVVSTMTQFIVGRMVKECAAKSMT